VENCALSTAFLPDF